MIEGGPAGVSLAVAASGFEGVARELAHGLKFGRRLALAGVAARAILRACPPEELKATVVPVPAAPWRWRWRGFDPAEEIALALAAIGSLPYAACLRRAHGPRQVGRERRARLADPPRVRAGEPVPGRALLVDDVYTTGTTLAACASALRGAGCERVVALTLARSEKAGLPRGDGRRSIIRPT
jgi:predicted amidophosphoribosyltransferase